MPGLLLGTSISGRADAAAREAVAQESLAALHDAGTAQCVNLTFVDAASPAGRCEVLPVLRLDAPSVSGTSGPRRPIVSEMLDALAAVAVSRGIDRIGLVNGDILVTRDAAQRALDSPLPALAFSRTDVGGGEPDKNLLYGVDLFTFDVTFWRERRDKFRAYPLGDGVWDNVYAAVVICHGGLLLNRERLILHERHPRSREGSAYARYVHLLAARDRSYFTLWCQFAERAQALRTAGGTRQEEEALQRDVFRPPTLAADAMDMARATWWRARRALGA